MANIESPSSVAPGDDAALDAVGVVPPISSALLGDLPRPEPVEREEGDRQQRDDDEHAPAHRLLQREPAMISAPLIARRPLRGRCPRARSARRAPRRRPRPPRPARARSAGCPRAWPARTSASRGRCRPRRRRRALSSCRRARRDDLAAGDDRHAVADQLDLRQQVRVQQHRDAALAQVLEQLAHRPPPGRVERAASARRAAAASARRSSPARSRAAAACPSTSPPRAGRRPRPARPARAARAARPRRRGDFASFWCSTSSSSALSQSGKRNSSAR